MLGNLYKYGPYGRADFHKRPRYFDDDINNLDKPETFDF